MTDHSLDDSDVKFLEEGWTAVLSLHCKSLKRSKQFLYDNFGKCGPVITIISLLHFQLNGEKG